MKEAIIIIGDPVFDPESIFESSKGRAKYEEGLQNKNPKMKREGLVDLTRELIEQNSPQYKRGIIRELDRKAKEHEIKQRAVFDATLKKYKSLSRREQEELGSRFYTGQVLTAEERWMAESKAKYSPARKHRKKK